MKNPFRFLFTKSALDSDYIDPASKYSLHKSIGLQGDKVLDSNGYLSLSEISLYINKGINKRAEKVGQIKFKLYKRGTKEQIEDDNEWLNLLDRPNKEQTGDMFWKLASIYHDTCGFALIKKIGNDAVFSNNQKVTELKLINPIGVTINYDGNKIKSFTAIDEITGVSEVIPYEQCIYWVNPNPKKPTEGMSILRSGLYSIDTDNELTKYQNAILKNSGMVDSIFTFKGTLNKAQLKELKSTYREEYVGSKANNSALFLGGDAQFQKLGLTPVELAYLESRKMTIDDMSVVTGVPKYLLAISSGETFANAETGYRIFLQETIRPIMDDLVNTLDWRLIPMEYDLCYEDPTPEDETMKLKKVEVADKVNALTTNEKREMLGFEPIDGNDDILVPFNKVPQSMLEAEQKGARPIFSHPFKAKDIRHAYHKAHIKSLRTRQNAFKTKLVKYLKDQKKRVLNNISEKKMAVINKDLRSSLFNEDLEVVLAYPLLEQIKEIAKEAGSDVFDVFNVSGSFVFTEQLDAKLSKRFDFWSKKINETTAEQLDKQFSEWVENEETINDLVKRVEDTFDGITTARAQTIANTEIGVATQEAKLSGYTQIGIPTKIWVWSPGIKGGVRDDHRDIDGEEVPINAFFSNGMRHPLDQNADAGDIINCECTI